MLWEHGVVSSNLIFPTNNKVLSTRGQGHSSFKAKTRVRIPLGLPEKIFLNINYLEIVLKDPPTRLFMLS